jgi:multidrug efflux pump subunit AcrB
MIRLNQNSEDELIRILDSKSIGLEGNIIKLFETDNDEFKSYLTRCVEKDKESRRKRLEITKKVQIQNNELSNLNLENQKMLENLQSTLKEAEEQKIKIKAQNEELIEWRVENEKIQQDLQKEMIKSENARIQAEEAKKNAINDLDILQKRNQTELISTIVKFSLCIIVGVGIFTTGVYIFTVIQGKDTQIIGAVWSNTFGILLTNAFSIVGTIMGVKYALEKKD